MRKLIISAVATAFSAGSFATLFDFEGQSTGGFASITDTQGGLSVTVTPNTNGLTIVNDYSVWGWETSALGHRSLLGNTQADLFGTFVPLRFTFSSLVDGVSIQTGDGGGDDDGDVILKAYNAGDGLLDTITVDMGDGATLTTLTSLAQGISYFTVETNAGVNTHSLVYDNLNANVVPEPATLIALGVGTLAVLRRRCKK